MGTGFRIRSCAKGKCNVGHHALTNGRPVLRLWSGAAQPLRLETKRDLRLEGNDRRQPDNAGRRRSENPHRGPRARRRRRADVEGRYAHARREKPRPNAKFTGFGRSATDKAGLYVFDTIKPGSVPGPDGNPQAPHIVVCIFSRGMLRQIYTRLYFSDEAANGADPILALVPADRRGTLIAHKQPGSGPAVYRFDIRVQGDNETVFFDI